MHLSIRNARIIYANVVSPNFWSCSTKIGWEIVFINNVIDRHESKAHKIFIMSYCLFCLNRIVIIFRVFWLLAKWLCWPSTLLTWWVSAKTDKVIESDNNKNVSISSMKVKVTLGSDGKLLAVVRKSLFPGKFGRKCLSSTPAECNLSQKKSQTSSIFNQWPEINLHIKHIKYTSQKAALSHSKGPFEPTKGRLCN